MSVAKSASLTLKEFLKLPETKSSSAIGLMDFLVSISKC